MPKPLVLLQLELCRFNCRNSTPGTPDAIGAGISALDMTGSSSVCGSYFWRKMILLDPIFKNDIANLRISQCESDFFVKTGAI